MGGVNTPFIVCWLGVMPAGRVDKTTALVAMPTVDCARAFENWDKDKAGFLTLEEYRNGLSKKENVETRFRNFDKNSDGKVFREEFINVPVK